MKRIVCRRIFLKVSYILTLVCLLASFTGGSASAQSGHPDGAGNPAKAPIVYLPFIIRSCPVIPAKQVQCVDCPKNYYDMTPGSLRFDPSNHPHIAYGGDHLYHAWNDGSVWHYETVDPGPGVGVFASLGIDSTGKPAIAFYDRFNQDLKYARWTGSAWTISVLDATQYAGLGTLVSFDGTDHPVVAYIGADGSGYPLVKVTRWNGSAWIAYPVVGTPQGSRNFSFSMALDNTGKPHVSYFGENGLMYASWTGSAWDTQTVVADSNVGAYNSLAFDSLGNPHISYYTFDHVAYASRTGASTWATEDIQSRDMTEYSPTTLVIDSNDMPMILVPNGQLLYKKNGWQATWGAGPYASLALDQSGKPHISSFDNVTRRLVYASLTDWGVSPNPPTWTAAYLDTQSLTVGVGVQMVVDARGNPYIVYIDRSQNRVDYATLVNGCWQIQTLNPIGTSSPADALGLALDPLGNPHVAYVDVANLKIVYVSWNGIGWVSEYAADDSVGYQGTFERYMSLALDASGNPFISYYDGGTISLRMAKKVGGVWQTELVDGTGSSWKGYYNSITVDSQGHPHISYMSYPNSLWYAHWDGSQWVKVKPDVTPGVGDNSAITVDSSNLPSICYVDESTYQLKYAHYTGTTWELQMVSAPGPVHIGEDMDTCAIKIGPGNTPYISYYDHVTRHLLLAHRNGSSWPAETIDANGDTGLFNALAFFNGIPRLAYFHYGNYDVNYIQWGG